MKNTVLLSFYFLSFAVNAQLTNGLIAHFPFNVTPNDVSSSSIVGVNNGFSYGTDRNGLTNETMTNSNVNYCSFVNSAVKVAFPITISVWVNLNSINESNPIFLSDNTFNTSSGYWLTVLANTGQVAINFAGSFGPSNDNNRRSFVTNQALTLNEWHHITAIIRSYNDMEVIIDCVSASGSYSGLGLLSVVYSTGESRIGSSVGNSWNPSGNYIDGSIDQLAIWNRELTSVEMDSLCQKTGYLENKYTLDNQLSPINMYPIPATDFLVVSAPETISAIKIYSLDGSLVQELLNCQSEKVKMVTNDLKAGNYIIKVQTISGRIIPMKFTVN